MLHVNASLFVTHTHMSRSRKQQQPWHRPIKSSFITAVAVYLIICVNFVFYGVFTPFRDSRFKFLGVKVFKIYDYDYSPIMFRVLHRRFCKLNPAFRSLLFASVLVAFDLFDYLDCTRM